MQREIREVFFLPSSVLDISSFRKNYMEVIEKSQGTFQEFLQSNILVTTDFVFVARVATFPIFYYLQVKFWLGKSLLPPSI